MSPPRRATLADRADSIGMQPAAKTRPSPVDAIVAPPLGAPTRIPIALIDPHPDNPREELELDDDFIASVQSMGVMQAITVVTTEAFWTARGVTDTVDSGRYVVLMGHRRRAAAEKAGLVDVPAVVRDDLAGDSAVVVMLIENLHRKDLNALEEARGFAKLRELGLDQDAIAKKVGKSQSHVSKRLGLLKLPDEILAEVGTEDLPVSEAQDLARYADDPEILRTAMRAPVNGSVDAVAKRIQERREQDKAVDARVTELTKANPELRIVKWPDGGWWDYAYPNNKTASLAQLRNASITIKPDEHTKLPCHGVSIGFRNGELAVVDVCTDVKKHMADKNAARDKANQARARKEAKAREAIERQAEARREIVKQQLAGRALPAATRQLASQVLIEYLLDLLSDEDCIELAAFVFGVDAEAKDLTAQLRAKAATTAGMDKLFAAVAFGAAEDILDRSYALRTDHAIAGPYVRWLQSLGHKPAGREREVLAEAKR